MKLNVLSSFWDWILGASRDEDPEREPESEPERPLIHEQEPQPTVTITEPVMGREHHIMGDATPGQGSIYKSPLDIGATHSMEGEKNMNAHEIGMDF